MNPIDGDEHGRDGTEADEIDRVGDDPAEVPPLKGLLDPGDGTNSPASDADAQPPG
jgi:hypothetical protein